MKWRNVNLKENKFVGGGLTSRLVSWFKSLASCVRPGCGRRKGSHCCGCAWIVVRQVPAGPPFEVVDTCAWTSIQDSESVCLSAINNAIVVGINVRNSWQQVEPCTHPCDGCHTFHRSAVDWTQDDEALIANVNPLRGKGEPLVITGIASCIWRDTLRTREHNRCGDCERVCWFYPSHQVHVVAVLVAKDLGYRRGHESLRVVSGLQQHLFRCGNSTHCSSSWTDNYSSSGPAVITGFVVLAGCCPGDLEDDSVSGSDQWVFLVGRSSWSVTRNCDCRL